MKVPIRVKSFMPDRTDYKQYGIMYEPEGLVVEVEISEKEVVSVDALESSVVYTVTEEGLKAIVSKLADLTNQLDKEHLKQIGGLK